MSRLQPTGCEAQASTGSRLSTAELMQQYRDCSQWRFFTGPVEQQRRWRRLEFPPAKELSNSSCKDVVQAPRTGQCHTFGSDSSPARIINKRISTKAQQNIGCMRSFVRFGSATWSNAELTGEATICEKHNLGAGAHCLCLSQSACSRFVGRCSIPAAPRACWVFTCIGHSASGSSQLNFFSHHFFVVI